MGTTRTLRLPKPLPYQIPILLDPARFKVICCGRRWGKTATGLQMILRGHGPTRDYRRGALSGGNMLWVAPFNKTLKKRIWPDLKKVLSGVWTDKSEVDHIINLPGGGRIEAVSAENPDGLVGDGYDGMVIDEAARVNRLAWEEALRPTLSDRGGWSTFITTPNGLNWFHDLFIRAGQQAEWQRWQRPTRENPIISASELVAARESIGLRAFAQEYEAEFTDVDGAEWPGEYFGDGIWFDDWPAAEDIRFRVIYLDPSLGATDRSDYSAYVMLALGWNGDMWIDADIERRDAFRMVDNGLSLHRAWHPTVFGVESNGFQGVLAPIFAERSKASGLMLPLQTVNSREKKITRIRAELTPYLARGEFRFRRGSRGASLLVEQLKCFPVDKHDDGPDALAGAIMLAKQLHMEASN
jgi:predicted phage terminase large subunit-like protein